MAKIDPIQRYRSFISRLKQNIYICPNCKQFFNETTSCECGYCYQEGCLYDYINESGERRTQINELICFEANTSEFLSYLNKIDLNTVHNYFIKSGMKYIINNMYVTPTILCLQNTIEHLYTILTTSNATSSIQSGGWELTKTDKDTIICKFIAKPVYLN